MYHLDQNPGYMIQEKGNASSCVQSPNLTTIGECRAARLALDHKADPVQSINNGNLPTGCFRKREVEYRRQEEVSSYWWYFNSATTGQSDSESELVCEGKAQRRCLCIRSRSALLSLHASILASFFAVFTFATFTTCIIRFAIFWFVQAITHTTTQDLLTTPVKRERLTATNSSL